MPDKPLTLTTFNCNSVRQRQEQILEWLAFNDPDILCLQETKVEDHLFPRQDFEDAGYHVACKGMKSWNGVAILSRQTPDEVAWGLDDDGPTIAERAGQDDARILRARFGDLAVVNTYVPQGFALDSPKYAYKLEWFTRLRQYFERHFTPGDAVIWTGDLNVAPTADDVHDPKRLKDHVCFHSAARDALTHVVDWGFVDVFRKHLPEPGHFTFWDYRQGSLERNKGWRIDHVMATAPLAACSKSVWVDTEARQAEKPSDHTFVTAVFGR